MKKFTIIISTVFLAFIALIIFININTSDAIISKRFNEDTVIRSVTVTKYAPPKDRYSRSEEIAKVTTEDEELIEEMIKSFSGLWLRREINARERWDGEYRLEIKVSNEREPGKLWTNNILISFDESDRIAISAKSGGRYFVINGNDYYEKMKKIIDKLDWK
ncbi:hypothetical protein [Bacillus sp. FJAT-45066]|uniref:hypothetical protein n=1 Tax=Bacillus sp. FJAT-45066 TaxID=2011010 RepID=UPI000BB862EA|nr:hypothetical protein [Bacillus sp. FJAT-45066]